MKVKFENSDKFILLNSYLICSNLVALSYESIEENLEGFVLYDDDESTIVKNCSDFIYRWDVYEQRQNQIYYTNNEGYRQREPHPNDPKPVEAVSPLTNEELTQCVADLMFETSLMKLGMEVE